MAQAKFIGLEITRNFFQIHGADGDGQSVLDATIPRGGLLSFFAEQDPCLVTVSRSAGADHWARKLSDIGHTAAIAPSVSRKKAGQTEAQSPAVALCSHGRDQRDRLVPARSLLQQSQDLQNSAAKMVKRQRLQIMALIRSAMADFGYVVPTGSAWISALQEIVEIEGRSELPTQARVVLQHLFDLLDQTDHMLARIERERLSTAPGGQAAK